MENFEFQSKPSTVPVYIQLARAIAERIDNGQLNASAPLPSSRELGRQLKLSRDTVVKAYRELARLGYITSLGPKGTFITFVPVTDKPHESANDSAITPSTFGKALLELEFSHPSSARFTALNFGAVPRDALPIKAWRQTLQDLCVPETFHALEFEPNVMGRVELRQSIQQLLWRTKGLHCEWGQIAIFAMSSGVITALCRTLLEADDTIAVEEPGYGAIKNIAKSLNIQTVPISLDAEGMSIESLKSRTERIKMVYVTSGHHDPLGIIMSPKRREQLLDWATNNNAWIIEDDYDGFYYYGRRPTSTGTCQ